MIGQCVPDDQQAVLSRGDLRIVMLVEALVRAVFHDLRFGIGEIVLIVVAGSWGRWRGRTTSWFVPRRAGFFFALTQLHFISDAVGSVPCLGPGLDHGFGLSQAGPALLPPDDFFADDQSLWQGFPLLSTSTQRQQILDFFAQVRFDLDQTMVTHGFALGSIGMNLRAIQ